MSFDVGQLVDVDYKVGMGVSSSHVKSLDLAFVTLRFVIRDAAGKLQGKTMELSLPEFNAFLQSLRDAQQAMLKL